MMQFCNASRPLCRIIEFLNKGSPIELQSLSDQPVSVFCRLRIIKSFQIMRMGFNPSTNAPTWLSWKSFVPRQFVWIQLTELSYEGLQVCLFIQSFCTRDTYQIDYHIDFHIDYILMIQALYLIENFSLYAFEATILAHKQATRMCKSCDTRGLYHFKKSNCSQAVNLYSRVKISTPTLLQAHTALYQFRHYLGL